MFNPTSLNNRMAGVLMATAALNGFGILTTSRADDGPSASPDATAAATPTRADIAEKYRWNLCEIYPDDAAFEAAFKKTEGKLAELPAFKGKLGQSADSLLRAIKTRDDTVAELDKVLVYAGLSHHEDMSKTDPLGRWGRAQSLSVKAGEATSWIRPEILAIPWEQIEKWLGENKELAVYRHYLEDIFREKEHTLTPREEELLAMAGEVASAPENIYSQYTNTELDFPTIKDEKGADVKLSAAKYTTFIYSPDRRVRRDAFLGMHQTYQAKKNTFAAMLGGHVKQHIFYARARKFDNALQSALNGPNVPVVVYDNLINSIHKHAPKLHRYVKLRKKLMGLDEIHAYDLYVPLVKGEEDKIPYDDAVGTILKALQPLGDDYVGTLQKSFESRWIDVYETPNKRSGAYCWGAYLTHPYLLLNYNGTMNDRSTTAHEMGHAMHSWYTQKKQPYIYGDYATFCAEVASTVNEVILAQYLLQHAKDDTEKLLILQQQIDGIRTTVFRQTLFAEFEKLVHAQAEAGEPVTGDSLLKIYRDLNVQYYGPELAIDDSAPAECLRIPHFYRNFYVYTYATSYCAATNIARRIMDDEPGAVDGLMSFLSAGSSKYPLDVLKLAGVDMTTPQPIEDAMNLFEQLLDQFEALYKKSEVGSGKSEV